MECQIHLDTLVTDVSMSQRIPFDPTYVEKIFRRDLSTITRTQIPHNVENYLDSWRVIFHIVRYPHLQFTEDGVGLVC